MARQRRKKRRRRNLPTPKTENQQGKDRQSEREKSARLSA
jgi:hypothetical protein